MTYKEFLAWLEGYLQAVPTNQIFDTVRVNILNKARSVKAEPNIAENISDKIKQILHD